MAAGKPSLASELARHVTEPLAPVLQELMRPRALAALAAGSALWYWWRLRRRVALGTFPEVPGLPILGVVHKIDSTDRYLETLEGWSREYGKEEGIFELNLAGERMVVFCEWEACQPILAGRPFKVTRPQSYFHVGLIKDEIGLFFAEGRQWSAQRRMISPAFNVKSVEGYLPSVCTIVDNMLARLRVHAAEGQSANVTDLARKMDADIISKVAFGQDFGALDRESPELNDAMTWFDALVARVSSPFPYWKLPFGDRVDGGAAAAKRFRSRLRQFLSDPSATVDSTLLGKMMSTEGEKLSHKEIVGNLEVLFLAGTDTTSHSLGWALYELARQQELQEEVAAEVAKLPAGAEGARRLDELLLLQALWRETLRLHSVTPWLDAELQEPIVVKGRTLPAKTSVWLLFREMCRNSAEFRSALGEDFDAFRPRRWLAPGGGLVECKPLDLIAFGHGARMCVGKNLAMLVGPLVLSEILRKFRVERWEGPALRERTSFVQCAERDVELRFAVREG